MQIREVIKSLEQWAPPAYQESYDNAGLITGEAHWEFKGSIVCLDSTEDVIQEAIDQGANMVIAHHPIVFKGLKRFNGRNYVERAIIKAIKHDIAIYAIHTNLDNVRSGVNEEIADRIGLAAGGRSILMPKKELLQKVEVYVPQSHLEAVQEAMWKAGAGSIGAYDRCAFMSEGQGTYRPLETATPYSGTVGEQSKEAEVKLEMIVSAHKKSAVLSAMQKTHPYESVSYQLIALENVNQEVGTGLVGRLDAPIPALAFLAHIKDTMQVGALKHTAICHDTIECVAVVGGSGFFGLQAAKASGAQIFITSDVKYHEYFDADGDIILVDIGHYESEQYTQQLLQAELAKKYPTFAHLLTKVKTNPVNYL